MRALLAVLAALALTACNTSRGLNSFEPSQDDVDRAILLSEETGNTLILSMPDRIMIGFSSAFRDVDRVCGTASRFPETDHFFDSDGCVALSEARSLLVIDNRNGPLDYATVLPVAAAAIPAALVIIPLCSASDSCDP